MTTFLLNSCDLSDYDSIEELEKDFNSEMLDFEIQTNSNIYSIWSCNTVESIFDCYNSLSNYDDTEIDIIVKYCNFFEEDITDINIQDTLDHYFGRFTSSYAAGLDYLEMSFSSDLDSAFYKFAIELPEFVEMITSIYLLEIDGFYYYQ